MNNYDVIIIGAGASGLMCANHLQNKKYIVLEKNNEPGKKLLITGNGRCNLTNLKLNKDFIKEITHNQKYLYSTIFNYGPNEIYNFFNQTIPLKEEKDNQIFPISDKAQDILNKLIKNINISYNQEVLKITKEKSLYKITTNKEEFTTKNIVIATGGNSFNHTGSTGIHKLANQLNQPLINYYPVEVGLITKNKYDLAGTSFEEVKIIYKKKQSIGKLIFTHQGISGTSPMGISEYLNNEYQEIIIDYLPNITKEELYQELQDNREVFIHQILNKYFTKKFAEYITSNILIKQIDHKKLISIINNIKEYKCIVKPDKLNNAYVTGGGIDLKQIDTKTFESKLNENIYFIGECLDIHGPIGGYNLTLAFSTAVSAANSIINIKKVE